ncbi:MAG: hypothetical protein AAGG72_06790 [Pseudomonadota bacterium]
MKSSVAFLRAHRCVLLPVVAVGLIAGGCARSHHSGTAHHFPGERWPSERWQVAGPSHHLSRNHVAPPRAHRLLIEDDGIEEQVPPRRKRRPVEDDASEPYSPNYGAGSIREGALTHGDPDRDMASEGWRATSLDGWQTTVRLDDPAYDGAL